jgi:uncharacterized iron-regulated membrane protein
MKRGLKYWIGRLHLWLGLSVGAVVLLVSMTGAIYVFSDEITAWRRADAIHHGEADIDSKRVLPLAEMERLVNDHTHEQYPVHWVNVPIDKSQCYVFNYYETDTTAWNYFNEYVIYRSVYINPFSGKILGDFDEKYDFFNLVKSLHFSMFLKAEWGTYVTGIPTLIFVFMLISGIVLWWPRSRAAFRQRTWFRWNNGTAWRRRNYDLHSILGFYASSLALVIATTGLFYAFLTVQALIYFVFSGGSTQYPDFDHIKTTAPIEQRSETTLDRIGQQVEQLHPDADMYFLDLGHDHLDHHEHPNYSVYVKQLSYSYHINHDLIFDDNSGELLHKRSHNEKNLGEKAVAANYDLHVGAILGLPTKFLALFLCLICASLPVTGFMMWWGRRNKQNTSGPD